MRIIDTKVINIFIFICLSLLAYKLLSMCILQALSVTKCNAKV
jgi:ABC-type uncharacterized transport system permease subunit